MPPGLSPPEEILRINVNIDRLRGERELSAATVAALSGIPISTWYRRREKPQTYTLGELADIAQVLHVSIAELVA